MKTFVRILSVSAVLASMTLLTGCGAANLFSEPAEDVAGSSSVFDVQVGDCLVEDTQVGEVVDTQIVSCDAPHTYEVFEQFAVQSHDDSFPGAVEVKRQAEAGCNPAFAEFIGLPDEESTVGYSFLFPSESSWSAQNSRNVTCLVKMMDNSVTTGSLKGSMK